MKTLSQFLFEAEEKEKDDDLLDGLGDDSSDNKDKDEDTEEKDEDSEDEDSEDSEDSEDEEKIDMNGFVVLKPGFLDKENELNQRLEEEGWKIVGEQEKKLSEQEAKDFYKNKEKEPYYEDLVEYMSSGKSKCFMLWKEDSEQPLEEIRVLKEKLRQEWSEDDMKNALHSSDSWDAMEKELSIFLAEPEEEDEEEKDTEDDEKKDSENTEDEGGEESEGEDDGGETEDESEDEDLDDLGL